MIQSILKDPSVANSVLFCAAAVAGQLGHAVKKWTEGESWILSNWKRTVGAVLTNIVGMAGFVSTGALDEITKVATIIALGLFMGFSSDSAINKGSRAVWTDADRAKVP